MRPLKNVTHFTCGAVAIFLISLTPTRAQSPTIDEIKGKIFDAQMAEKTFADGLKHCEQLDGKSFFYRVHNRILNLEEYFHSLENLAKAEVFNPEKRRPWSLQDAKERWEEVKKEAKEDKEKCELVKSLPQLEKQLEELQKNSAASPNKN